MQLNTPFGPAWVATNGDGAVTNFEFGETVNGGGNVNTEVARQLEEFFACKRRNFDLPLAPQGSDFQKLVWAELCRIPFGETISYSELAQRVGRPHAARAVGRANATNPIALIVPCHRVIGANGTLTGYGGGLELKAKLLDWERGQARLFANHASANHV